MSISPLKCLSYVFVLFSILSRPAFAIEACGPGAIDPDQDGWGWEDGMSCRIAAVEKPQPGICASPDSDADGDGWGWENGASCRVDAGSTNTPDAPGSDFDSASTIQLNSDINATINGVDTHYYKFDLVNNTSVELNTDFIVTGSIESSIKDRTSTYFRAGYDEKDVCLTSGTYFLTLDRRFIDTANSIDYSINLATTDTNCVAPVSRFESTYDEVFVTNDGSVYLTGYSDDFQEYRLSKVEYNHYK